MAIHLFLFLVYALFAQAVQAQDVDQKDVENLVQAARNKNLARALQWKRFLHYQGGIFGWKSEADGPEFFFAKDGKTNPEAELEATLRALFSPASGYAPDKHPRCRFPARYEWLKEQLGFSDSQFKNIPCAAYDYFVRKLNGKSVTFVFSGYYLNNPSSAFGHNLLRINSSPTPGVGKTYELLDFGVNHAALVTTNNAFLYGFYGLVGGFKGTFTAMPYYYKVREYNDAESRDLWEYDLNFTQAEINRLVDHLWELGSTWFDYYYFTENCAYHILTALDAAKPELFLGDRLPWIVIPVDAVKTIYTTPGLVKNLRFRPSLRRQFELRHATLNETQNREFRRLMASGKPEDVSENLDAKSRAAVIDTAMDAVDFRFAKDLLDERNTDQSPARIFKNKLLQARAKIAIPTPDLEVKIPDNEAPQSGHESMRLGLLGGYETKLRESAFTRIDFRWALHDLLDPITGYPDGSTLLMGGFRARWDHKLDRFRLDEVNLFEAQTLTPFRFVDPKVSWRIQLNVQRFEDKSCAGCHGAFFEVGGGSTFKLFKGVLVYGMGDSEISVADFNQHAFRPGIGPSLGFRVNWSERFISLFEARYRYRFFAIDPHHSELRVKTRWAFAKDFALDGSILATKTKREFAGGLYWYF